MGDVGGEAAPRLLTARSQVLSPSPRALQDPESRILDPGARMTDALKRPACLRKETGAGAVPGALARDAGTHAANGS